MIIIPTEKLINAMSTIQSSLSGNQSRQSPIELADKAQKKLFVASLLFGLVVALLTALLAWLLWRANNKYQDTVKAHADARMAEAGRGAAEAQEKAGEANERAQILESSNLTLRNDLNIATAKVAGLEKAASDALAEQQRVQTELAKQQRRTAEAEQRVLELHKQIQPRTLRGESRKAFIALTSRLPKGPIEIQCQVATGEPCVFAKEIYSALDEAGWTIGKEVFQILSLRDPPVGLILLVKNREAVPVRAVALQQALEAVTFSATLQENANLSDQWVVLVVGLKP